MFQVLANQIQLRVEVIRTVGYLQFQNLTSLFFYAKYITFVFVTILL